MPAANISVCERQAGRAGGAGINFDDLSVALFKLLGLLTPQYLARLQPMRCIEERTLTATGPVTGGSPADSWQVLDRMDDAPLFAAYWGDVYTMLLDDLVARSPEIVQFGQKLVAWRQLAPASGGKVVATFDDGSVREADLLIGADGPNSSVRAQGKLPGWDSTMRYAGYFAWRGVLRQEDCPPELLKRVKAEYTEFGDALYFVMRDGDQEEEEGGGEGGPLLGAHGVQEHGAVARDSNPGHQLLCRLPSNCCCPGLFCALMAAPCMHAAVFYLLGGELMNWLVYSRSERPLAPVGEATTVLLFHCLPLPFLAVPMPSQPTVACRLDDRRTTGGTCGRAESRGRRALVRQCSFPFQCIPLSVCFSAFHWCSAALTDRWRALPHAGGRRSAG
eukprot:SAG22_NODE_241_length_14126_cov_9.747202_5_plen_391_part_00